MAGLDAIADKLAELKDSGLSGDALHAALADFIKTLPQFEDSGVNEDSTTWGRFADGRLALVIDNRELVVDPNAANTLAPLPAGNSKFNPMSVAAIAGIPAQPQVRLLHMLGVGETGEATVSQMHGLFTSAGYNDVGSAGGAKVGPLRSVSGDGFFYINTHGGSGRRRVLNTLVSAIWTSTRVLDENGNPIWTRDPDGTIHHGTGNQVVNGPNATDNLADIQADISSDPPRLVYALADSVEGTSVAIGWNYAFTPDFVTRYMSFAPDSLVWLNSCFSYDQSDWRAVFKAKGAGAFIGWAGDASPSAVFDAPPYLVDRLLGANVVMPETPKQRPFDLASLWDDLTRVGLDQGAAGTLRFEQGTFGIFAPSLAYADPVDEANQKLTVHGLFGARPGAIYIGAAADGSGGTPLGGCAWASDTVTCTISPNQGGYIVASVNNVRSNPIHLTSWRVKLHYSSEIKYGDPNSNAIMKMESVVHIRADIHAFRQKPHDAPVDPNAGDFVGAPDSSCSYSAFGTYPDTGSTVTLSGAGTIPVATHRIDPNSDNACFFYGRVDWGQGVLKFGLMFGAQNAITATVTDSKGTHVLDPLAFEGAMFPGLSDSKLSSGAPVATVYFDGETLKGNDVTADISDSWGNNHLRLYWDDTVPEAAPDDTTAR